MFYFKGQSAKIKFLLVSSTDHVTPVTGATCTILICTEGGSFTAATGTTTEVGNGWYSYASSTIEANVLGALLLHATASGADPSDKEVQIVAFNPGDAVRLGLTALPNANAGAVNGVPTSGDASGSVRINQTTMNNISSTIWGDAPFNYLNPGTFGNIFSLAFNNSGQVTGLTPAYQTTLVNAVVGGTLVTPANKLATDASGNVSLAAATQTSIGGAAATAILATPANKLVTDGTGNVSLASATQTSIGGAAATAILATPANKLVTDGSGSVAASNLVTGLLDLANGVETSVTVRQALRLCAAALGGVLAGGDGTNVTIQAAGNSSTPRVSATVDTNGNRTAVALTL
jgi:hypothetical protein